MSIEEFDDIFVEKQIKAYLNGDVDPIDFESTNLYKRIEEYFYASGEMPYGTMKARDGDPAEWIFAKLEEIYL